MLNCNSINAKIISMAEAIRAEILYEVSMNVNLPSFYPLRLQKTNIEQAKLNFNLYK